MKRNEYSLRDLWDNIKCTNISLKGFQKGKREREREREKGTKNILEDVILKNFPNLGKETDI